MQKEHNESPKLILGMLIGSIVGAGALYCIHAAQNRKTPLLQKIGKPVTDVGEMLENCDMSSGSNVLQSIEKNIPNGGAIVDGFVDWVDAGLTVWKKFKRG
jgi:hypothetical protein